MRIHFTNNHTLTIHDTQVVDGKLVDTTHDKEFKLGEVVILHDLVSRGAESDLYFSDEAVAYAVPSDFFERLPDQAGATPPTRKCCGQR